MTGYQVERCQGGGCSTSRRSRPRGRTSYKRHGLTAGTSYSYRVRAIDAAGNLGRYQRRTASRQASPDTQPPTAPASLTATVVSPARSI